MKIRVKTEVRPTEDENKVKKALLNIFVSEKVELIEEDGKRILVSEEKNIESLSKLREMLRKRRILSAAKAVLKRSITEDRMVFYLNKQAAYMGQISFCEKEGESPLGPITVEIVCEKINEVIDWLTSEN
ncbi:MAG: RNA-binding domain-containing protein [Candidatus Methanomethylicia archaeon]